ncbi:carotenoid oxygenase family protein [Mycolicibacterium hippocampi]|uniref:Dioxygenase n=1 Tax=Mycolicibacterium hippocampi TaxID=659824 RepID=A0A7I9ZFQ2_9MYCO|nr:carotenoid oxygenase family protein [Mycolicibacterium hippocampi]GFG99860.1 retinal pigment epithelial membrane protein [Mycolicibacterium hippocampi]
MTDTASDHTEANTLFGAGEFFQRGNYAPVPEELTTFDLEVEGAVPAEVTGWYLRNGPNPRETTGHWFTGDGMIHGVRIEGGRAAWYRNRWVRTESFEHDFPLYEEDGARNLRASVANTHVVNHAGKTLALVESSLPYEITNDLDTVGAYDFDGKLTNSMTAHPKICPTTGEMHFFGYGSLVAPHVVYHRADADGQLVINRPLEVKALTMMHDFALTANHVVFMDLPIVFDFDIAASGSGDMPYRWDDDYGARLGLLRRDDPYGEVRWFEIDPCYVFHVANAYERGDTVVVQGVRYPELWRQNGGFDTDGMMWTWTVDLRRGTVTESQLDERAVEFPRIDDRLATLQARYAVSVGDASLVRHDLVTGDAVEHRFGTPEAPGGPGEAVFVPAAGAADESSGWYLGYVYDPTRDGSDLVIIDASDFTGPPVARIKLPQRVPYGFHGNWIAD